MTKHDEITKKAMAVGQELAAKALDLRTSTLRKRERYLEKHPKAIKFPIESTAAMAAVRGLPRAVQTAGFLVAEGDSWFDYPFHDVLKELEDRFGYDVESVAHHGDPIEEMAYGGGQIDDLIRRIDKLRARGIEPKAILLSGGGNDVAGNAFGMLLNHKGSPISGLNQTIMNGVIDERIRTAYVAILSAVSSVCKNRFGKDIPILIHGYDFPVPDGRGFMGGWWFLPGPWLEPGFREKGFDDLQKCTDLAREMMERFNRMLATVAALPDFAHVRYVDLRGTLSSGRDYKKWWANELHPHRERVHRDRSAV